MQKMQTYAGRKQCEPKKIIESLKNKLIKARWSALIKRKKKRRASKEDGLISG
jgi:hypothetical protein